MNKIIGKHKIIILTTCLFKLYESKKYIVYHIYPCKKDENSSNPINKIYLNISMDRFHEIHKLISDNPMKWWNVTLEITNILGKSKVKILDLEEPVIYTIKTRIKCLVKYDAHNDFDEVVLGDTPRNIPFIVIHSNNTLLSQREYMFEYVHCGNLGAYCIVNIQLVSIS